MGGIPLGVLDLVPVSSGSTAAGALRNSIDLARAAERFGYARYWFAEHHLNPGVAGTSPAVVLALTAAATSRIRIGSGAVQMGHRTALATVEEFGLIDALHPGRLDLGLGRSGGGPSGGPPGGPLEGTGSGGMGGGVAPHEQGGPGGDRSSRGQQHLPNGLLIPPRFSPDRLLASPRFELNKTLLQLPGAHPQDYGEQVADILALLAGTYRSPAGIEAHAVPGERADVQVWILGSSGGQSAQVAGANGLRFAANYHVSPATVLEAAEGYRAAFRPVAELSRPHVAVSADVVVAPDEATARELASGYGLWVRSIRSGEGAIAFPEPAEARKHYWTDADRELVADRVDTQFVGSPGQVADHLERLAEATGADELIITTITHNHADRVRSYRLLASEWRRRHPATAEPLPEPLTRAPRHVTHVTAKDSRLNQSG
jgi:alkanesulfonate monooxygenase SsuD/methylene tetrahydromethanopterin reductase-like flavin-dependent oxidoreductase (luciferase family)